MDGAAQQISTSTAEDFFAVGVRPFRGRWADQAARRIRTGGGTCLPCTRAGTVRQRPNRRDCARARALTGAPVISTGAGENVETVTAVAGQPSVDCSRGGQLELGRRRDHSVSLWRTGARPGPTASTAAGTDSVLRGVSARQAATSHRMGRSVVALARLLAPGPSGGAEPRRRGSDARSERTRRDCLWRWIRADRDRPGMHGCPRRSPGRPSGGVRPPALPPPRGGNSLATTIRTALPGRIGDAVRGCGPPPTAGGCCGR